MAVLAFRTRVQRAVFEKVQRYVQQIVGQSAEEVRGEPRLTLAKGSTRADVVVYPWGDEEATVTVRSAVVRGAKVNEELMAFLLQENSQFRLGAFSLDAAGTVYFQHSIIGTTCDKKELDASLSAVLLIADEYDDRIRARWGGTRAIDAEKPTEP